MILWLWCGCGDVVAVWGSRTRRCRGVGAVGLLRFFGLFGAGTEWTAGASAGQGNVVLVEYAEDGAAAAESAAAPDGVDGDAVVVHLNYLLFTLYARILALARCQFARTEHF